ncbi:Protein Brevis radix-like 1 [Acorus gramineus]|uniref:Protein Brevis radix-like 1 n=1 Tax=Acorus gramineus TaxID=55184 RepID=A0AAV9AHR0_ACOGR|nr:Protein Brevis radix-like 1 [Acorus gramineus]
MAAGEEDSAGTPSTRQAIKALTAQIKDMALKASGAYKHCKPCSGSGGPNHQGYTESESASERFHYSYRRAAAGVASGSSTPRLVVVKGGLSSGEGTPSMSGRSVSATAEMFTEEGEEVEEGREWVAQVEPGVLITFVSVARGGNDLKRIRFSREMFSKWQAQRWWAENYDKVMELYNVQKFNRQAVPLPSPPRSEEDESSKMESAEDSPVTPPLSKERLPRNFQKPLGYSSSDSLEHHPSHHPRHHHSRRQQHHHNHHNNHNHHHHYYDSIGAGCKGLASTPKVSSVSTAAATKIETSSMADATSARTSSSVERSGELSASNASDQETVNEWVEQDEPGVYITIRALPGGVRELRRVRFSRERFGEMHARLWWEENRARIHEQYL